MIFEKKVNNIFLSSTPKVCQLHFHIKLEFRESEFIGVNSLSTFNVFMTQQTYFFFKKNKSNNNNNNNILAKIHQTIQKC